MLLTKKDLKEYQESMRVNISTELSKELQAKYGSMGTDEEGHFYEYTEQDIYEQLRKLISDRKPPTINFDEEGRPYFKTIL